MIDDFAQPAWAEAHEKLAVDVAAGLARWLRRRAKAKTKPRPSRRIVARAGGRSRARRLADARRVGTTSSFPKGMYSQ